MFPYGNTRAERTGERRAHRKRASRRGGFGPGGVVQLAMPAPAISAILAESYHSDKELASRSVFLSSLLCLISIPLISLLL